MKPPVARILRLALFAAIFFAMALIPLAARANMLQETFTITVSSAATLVSGNNLFYAAASVAQFNSTLGTLTSISISVTGSGTWTSTASPQNGVQEILGGSPGGLIAATTSPFTTPGSINLNLTSSSSMSFELSEFTGTGTLMPFLNIYDLNTTGVDTFETNGDGLSDTLTYNYTPAVPTPTPEPSSFVLLGTAILFGFGWVWVERRRGLA